MFAVPPLVDAEAVLTNSTVVISVELEADDSPAPFALKPLVSEVADGIGDHQVQTLSASPTATTGTATID